MTKPVKPELDEELTRMGQEVMDAEPSKPELATVVQVEKINHLEGLLHSKDDYDIQAVLRNDSGYNMAPSVTNADRYIAMLQNRVADWESIRKETE